jgi:hypothetical protein
MLATELSGIGVANFVLVVDDTARDVLRAAFGARRGVMRRRDERVMTVEILLLYPFKLPRLCLHCDSNYPL